MEMNAILKEIEQLRKVCMMTSTKFNNTCSGVFFVPQLSSQKSFNKWQSKQRGFSSILEFISNGKMNGNTNEPLAVKFVISMLMRCYPDTFNQVVGESGQYSILERMDEVETAAVLSDMSVSNRAVMETMHRHLKYKTEGKNIFAKKKDLDKLTSNMPAIRARMVDYQKAPAKKVEKVGVVTSKIEEVISLDMDRTLESMIKDKEISLNESLDHPLFGYRLNESQNAVYVLIGTDHGQGTSQFLLQLNLGSSEERRQRLCPGLNTRTFPFATIKCQKDTDKILRMAKPEVEDGIKLLRTKQLVAVFDNESGVVKTYFIDKESHGLQIQNNSLTYFDANDIRIQRRLPEDMIILNDTNNSSLRIKTIIANFDLLQIGDLAAQMTLQGRDGMSSCRCIKCSATQSQWKQKDPNVTLLNLPDLCHETPNATIGQKKKPIWAICPSKTVVPILHCEIGTVNNQFQHLVRDLLLHIDLGTPAQVEMQVETQAMQTQLEQTDIPTRDMLERQYEFQQQVHDPTLKRLNKYLQSSNRKLATARRSTRHDKNERIQQHSKQVAITKRNIARIRAAYSSYIMKLDFADMNIIIKQDKIKSNIKKVKDIQWERRKLETSLYTTFERILTKNGVTIQAYHGGTMTGGAIINLLQRNSKVMDELESACIDRFNSRQEDDSPIRPPPLATIKEQIKKHRHLFMVQDAVYAHLRLLKPTAVELIETKTRISIMERLWHDMGLSETPKAHLIFKHAADDQEKFDGLGDKIEDPIEKRHQVQMKIDHILSRMQGGFCNKMKTQQKYEWRDNHPQVLKQIKRVKHASTRKITAADGLTNGYKRQKLIKEEREVSRAEFVGISL